MSSQHKSGWARGIRPLLWWLFLVLLLYGIRLDQRLLEQTRLFFSITLNGQPLSYPVTVTWDGKPIRSGDKISLGGHSFAIKGAQISSFTTNLSVWYGKHDLGEIRLMRSMGRLSVKTDPPAQSITITGPEFSTTLEGCSGTNLIVPTDTYNVGAQYRHWSDSQTVSVNEDEVSPVSFSEQIGAIGLTCNRDGATFQLQNAREQIENGNLPNTVADLPVGNYEVRVFYHDRRMEKAVSVEADTTNAVSFDFVLGAVQLESAPSGAEVHDANGDYLGRTPLFLPDMTPQSAQFTLSLSGYQPVSVTLDIAADQTNFCSTNLTGIGYESAIGEARTYLAAAHYEAAAQAAGAALAAKPNDAEALAIQNKANDVLNGERQQEQRLQRPKKWFDSLCSEYPDTSLFSEHELITSKPAGDAAEAIVYEFTNGMAAFKVTRFYSPESETYEIFAQQTFSLGILGGNERDCLIVVGQAKDDETQIRFKIMDFQIQHSMVNFQDQKRLVPISPGTTQMNDFLKDQVHEGLKDVTQRIQVAIGNNR
jgi:PEGA domain